MSDILDRFKSNKPTEGQISAMLSLRMQAVAMATTLDQLCPHSREKELALTNLEQSLMWANKSITHFDGKAK